MPDEPTAPVPPAQDPQVPAPGDDDSSAAPGVLAAQAEDAQGWSAIAAPGKPDGEVDTRP